MKFSDQLSNETTELLQKVPSLNKYVKTIDGLVFENYKLGKISSEHFQMVVKGLIELVYDDKNVYKNASKNEIKQAIEEITKLSRFI